MIFYTRFHQILGTDYRGFLPRITQLVPSVKGRFAGIYRPADFADYADLGLYFLRHLRDLRDNYL
jgi:hypothetical protein